MIGLLGSLIGGRGGRMLGGMLGGRTGAMVGGMAGAMLGGRQLRSAVGAGKAGLRGLRNGGDDNAGETELSESQAEILVRVMANSAKADGEVDEAEIDQILGELGDDITTDEREFLNTELASAFVPAKDIAELVPGDLAVDAYVVSLLTIQVDDGKEVDYLRSLAAEMGISEDDRDSIHDELGLDKL